MHQKLLHNAPGQFLLSSGPQLELLQVLAFFSRLVPSAQEAVNKPVVSSCPLLFLLFGIWVPLLRNDSLSFHAPQNVLLGESVYAWLIFSHHQFPCSVTSGSTWFPDRHADPGRMCKREPTLSWLPLDPGTEIMYCVTLRKWHPMVLRDLLPYPGCRYHCLPF